MSDYILKFPAHWVAIMALFVTGCSSWNPLEIQQVVDKKESQVTFYGSTAAVRNVVVRNKDGNRVVCAEPMPDTAFDEEEEADWDFSFISLGGDEKGEEQSGAVEAGLGGRSSNVLITREILFRYCEFLGNGNYSNEEKIGLFKTVLTSVVTINQKNLGTGTRALAGTSMDVEEGHSASAAPNKTGVRNESPTPSSYSPTSPPQSINSGPPPPPANSGTEHFQLPPP